MWIITTVCAVVGGIAIFTSLYADADQVRLRSYSKVQDNQQMHIVKVMTTTPTNKPSTSVIDMGLTSTQVTKKEIENSIVRMFLHTKEGIKSILIEVHPSWAPLGSKRFLELIENNFYSNCKFFRVIKVSIGINHINCCEIIR
jgi:hypothetical protein